MRALTRSKLPEGSEKRGDLWVSPAGRAYKENGRGYICLGEYEEPPSEKKPRRHKGGKLTDEDIAYIKGQLLQGASQKWLAKKFDVSDVTICYIAKGKMWPEIEAKNMVLEGPPKGAHKSTWIEYEPYDEE